jgi:hypothetical protein
MGIEYCALPVRETEKLAGVRPTAVCASAVWNDEPQIINNAMVIRAIILDGPCRFKWILRKTAARPLER